MSVAVSKKQLYELTGPEGIRGERSERPTGTNCEGFSITFHKGAREIRLFMKKSFLKGEISTYEGDYKVLKEALGNIVPNTVFILGKDGGIFSFSEPVIISFDVFDPKSKGFLQELVVKNPSFKKQLEFFIRKFRELQSKGKVIDIIGAENLVYEEGGKLKYIDTFLPFHEFQGREEEIESRISYLEDIVGIKK